MLSGLIARARSLWRGVRHRRGVDAEMTEEFKLHMELRTEDLVRSGVAPAEARRRARLEFGSTEQYKEQGAESRGLRRFDDMRVSWLDFKLGFRMLLKYPGLTIVGGLAIAFAIWVGAGTFELVTQVLRPTLPLAEGDRIVGIQVWDVSANRPEDRIAGDFAEWRTQLRSIEDVGAFRMFENNLITSDNRGEPVQAVEISASAFRVTRVRPLLGRALVADDEQVGAPAVAVIGHDVWRDRFGRDPGVVGRAVRLGNTPTTIVGVMPEKFSFPIAQNLWIPLRLSAADVAGRGVSCVPRRVLCSRGGRVLVFGRLTDGYSFSDAQAELETIGKRAAIELKETHEHLRPRLLPYAKSILNPSGWMALGVVSVNVPMLLLVILVCGNVALLMFARAATRETEIVVRTALGASRARIISQLFAEALVLGAVASVVGLAAAGSGIRWAMSIIEAEFLQGGRLPFWFHGGLSPMTVVYTVGLTLLGAVIAGVVPALKVTRGMGDRLKQAAAGAGGPRFGGIWTAVIVSQIAITVAFPVVSYAVRSDAEKLNSMDVGFPADEYLSLRLEMDRNAQAAGSNDTLRAAFAERFRTTYQELARRVAAEPGVSAVAFADRLPRTYHPHRLVDVDEGGAAPLNPDYPAYRVSSASVEPAFFSAVQAPILAGRGFTPADHPPGLGAPGSSGARGGVVIVNQSFVKLVLGGRNPIGRRLRYRLFEEQTPRTLREPGPWYQIVGVVRDMGMAAGQDPKIAGIYHPVAPGGVYPARMALHVRGDPASFAPRLRALATAVDPTLRLYDIRPLDDVNESELQFLSFWFRLLLGMSIIALTLSLAGIYSVMAFTVARRTREIGIRIALGADPRRLALAVFRRPLIQVALGIVAGATLTAAMMIGGSERLLSPAQTVGVVAYAVFMLAVCLLACIVPTRRALRVEPTEALRADG